MEPSEANPTICRRTLRARGGDHYAPSWMGSLRFRAAWFAVRLTTSTSGSQAHPKHLIIQKPLLPICQ